MYFCRSHHPEMNTFKSSTTYLLYGCLKPLTLKWRSLLVKVIIILPLKFDDYQKWMLHHLLTWTSMGASRCWSGIPTKYICQYDHTLSDIHIPADVPLINSSWTKILQINYLKNKLVEIFLIEVIDAYRSYLIFVFK